VEVDPLGPTLAREDSDGDDVPNGWELGDPDGVWKKGDLAPGSPNFVTSPGQAGSVPPVLSVTPLEIDHSELPGENLEQSVTIENIGGDCFGNPAGACTLSVEASTSDDWLGFEPQLAELVPLETVEVDRLFSTDGLLGDFDGTATFTAPDVLNSPQDVVVLLTVPEPGEAALCAAAMLSLLFVSRAADPTRSRT
jgi:hypothetical protein